MDEDDWRNWKNGRYDNRYHGVRKHSGKRYYGRGKSKALQIAIISSVIVAVTLFVLVGIPQLPQINLPNLISTKPSQTPSETSQGQTNQPTTGGNSQVVFSNCIMASNGAGGIRVNCENHDSVQCISDPPIGSGIQKDVTLTIDKNSCIVQYPNSQGSNTIYNFQLGTSSNTSNITPTTSPSILPKVTLPKISLPKVAIPTITIPGSSNVQPQTPPTDLPSLYNYALKIVNDDRKANGLGPVTLSNIGSAQNHANDQLALKYFSHWNSDGVKPYVVYTKLGGRGSVAENDYYTYSYCPTSNCLENIYDPFTEIKKGEDEMMNNDAASSWEHKKNILDPNHTHVNFGIAYNNDRFYFVQNFENNLINWQTIKLVGTNLVLSGTISAGYSIGSMDVFYDPMPKSLTESDLDNSSPYNAGYYDQGTDVGMVVPKPVGNSYYPECSPGKITVTSTDGSTQCLDYSMYQNNSASPNAINTVVDVSKWLGTNGLHTIYVNLKDSSGNLVQATSLTLEYLK
jgi:uncharacterized protein YkwD